MNKTKPTIIIPAYNEIYVIQELINEVNDLKISKQIIVVDDHSTDGQEIILKNENKINKLFCMKEILERVEQ